MKTMIKVKKSAFSTTLLTAIALFSISIILAPSSAYAEEISIKSVGVEKTSIITFTNDGTKNIETFRIWLGQDAKFESFKTEKNWIGEKNSQGVIVFTSSDSIKIGESVKFGIKTDKPNPTINWKGLDDKNAVIDSGVIRTSEIQKVNQNPQIDSGENKVYYEGGIFSDSVFRIIPDKPNAGSTIRVVGENFGASQILDFHIDNEKIGSFVTDDNGYFITTMKIPQNISGDRVDFKVKNIQDDEKSISLRLGESQNRIEKILDTKITVNGIDKIIHRGDSLDLFGKAAAGSSIIIEIRDPDQKVINSRTVKTDSIGNWKLESPISIPYNAPFGKYSITTSDGRSQNLQFWQIETNKSILLNPTKVMFDAGSIIKFNGTALPGQDIELSLEDELGNEVDSTNFTVNESGFVEYEYPTIENEDNEGTWTLVATQNNFKEFIFVGYGQMPQIPVNIEFNKTNYKTSENAIISLLGKPSESLKIMIINPTGSISDKEIEVKLQEDGRAIYELELTGFTSGIYTAVAQKGTSQSSEMFSVGLQMGSGPIQVQTTQTQYTQGERILAIGSTNPNTLLNVELVDPNGIKIKKLEIPSKSDGTFKIEKLKIPRDAISGTWKINVSSGSNLDKAEFEVNSTNQEGIIINVGEVVQIPGFGDSVKIEIITNQKTSVNVEVLDKNSNLIGESNSCLLTTDLRCEILWTFPDDIVPGTYTIRVNDSIITKETTFEIK